MNILSKLVCLFVIVLIALGAEQAQASGRIALIIGNADYAAPNQLANPANDAEDVAGELRKLDFKVTVAKNLKASDQANVLREFIGELSGADVALFYYAGHAMQIDGKNYLIPVDAQLQKLADVTFDTVSLDSVIDLMQRETKTNLVFLDACRDNPFANQLSRSMGASRSISMGNGLARTESGLGTMIAYATQPGNVAGDGEGRNSPFTTAFLKHVGDEGLEIRQVMTRVRADVVAATDSHQVPWDHSSLLGDFFFRPGAQASQPRTSTVADTKRAFDIAFWTSIQSSKDATDYAKYLEKFPDGLFAELARKKTAELESGQTETKPRGFLGFGFRPPNAQETQLYGLPPGKGAIVASTVPQSQAQSLGIEDGQLLASIDGKAPDDLLVTFAELKTLKEGDELRIEIRLPDGTKKDVVVQAASSAALDQQYRKWAEDRARLFNIVKKDTLYQEASAQSQALLQVGKSDLALAVDAEAGAFVKVFVMNQDLSRFDLRPAAQRFGYLRRSSLKEAKADQYAIAAENLPYDVPFPKQSYDEGFEYPLASRAMALSPDNLAAAVAYATTISTPFQLSGIVDDNVFGKRKKLLAEALARDPDNVTALKARIRFTRWDPNTSQSDIEMMKADFRRLSELGKLDAYVRQDYYTRIGDNAALEKVYTEQVEAATDRPGLVMRLETRADFYAKTGKCEDAFADLKKAEGVHPDLVDMLDGSIVNNLANYVPCFGKESENSPVWPLILRILKRTEGLGFPYMDAALALEFSVGDKARGLEFVDNVAKQYPQMAQFGFKNWLLHFIEGKQDTKALNETAALWVDKPIEAKLFLGEITPEAVLAVSANGTKAEKSYADPWRLFAVGMFYKTQGQTAEAERLFKLASEIEPATPIGWLAGRQIAGN
jgi:uncharacterized caspase-like protein/tetratricopeptide (TPR) repeat protein